MTKLNLAFADIKEWVKWGSEMVGDRYKIHPLVSAFVAASGMKAFYSTYDSENPPEYAIDPRGWEQISDILYDNDGVIFAELVENKIGKSMARAFVNFAQNPPLSLQDVMEDNFQPNDIPKSFDGKYALAVSLRGADFDQVAKVREFVGQYLGSENLAAFDSIWVDKDDEKAIYLKNLKQKQTIENTKTQPEKEVDAKKKKSQTKQTSESSLEKIKEVMSGMGLFNR